jgi:hypothetical protein
MPNYGLGRLHAPDPRDQRFQMPVRRIEAKAITKRTWFAGEVLDQGDTPQCVGYSCWKWLDASPIRNKPAFTPTDLYHGAQDNDEWPGNDYEGSSVRGAMKFLQQKGMVSNYFWAPGCEAVIDHILAVGPVVVGTDFYDGMFKPDKEGFIRIGGKVVGGHAYLLIGANRDKKAVRVLNSWSRRWAQGGRAYLSFDDLDQLLKANGEGAVATEVLAK